MTSSGLTMDEVQDIRLLLMTFTDPKHAHLFFSADCLGWINSEREIPKGTFHKNIKILLQFFLNFLNSAYDNEHQCAEYSQKIDV